MRPIGAAPGPDIVDDPREHAPAAQDPVPER